MKKYLLITAMLVAGISFAQHKKDTGFVNVDLEKLKRQIDSSNKILETLGNSRYKRMQDEDLKRMTENSASAFAAMQRERQAQEKKAMWRNLGLGIFFLAILIIGLLRKKKADEKLK